MSETIDVTKHFYVGDMVKVVGSNSREIQSYNSKKLKGEVGRIIKLGESHCVLDIEYTKSDNVTGMDYDEIEKIDGNDFNWAIKQMKEGKKVRRNNEDYSEDVYNYLKGDKIYLCDTEYDNHCEAILELSDFEANDWELYVDKEETLSDKRYHFGVESPFAYGYNEENVKDAVRRLLEVESDEVVYDGAEGCCWLDDDLWKKKIKEIFGDKLI